MAFKSSLIAILGAPFLLSGCVAAVLPLAALGTMGKTQIDRVKAKRELVAAGAVDIATSELPTAVGALTSDGQLLGNSFDGQGGIDIEEADMTSPEIRRYLDQMFRGNRSGQKSPYADFTRYALEQSAKVEEGENVSSSVLIPRVDIFKPETVACAGKPPAVLIDLDGDKENDWLQADTIFRQNGLTEALNQLRASNISVIWVSDRTTIASEQIAAILSEAGLSVPEANDFLFLDRGGADRKQARRWDAARSYCIIAMAGDKRSDFDELYDYLRDPDGAISLEYMFGKGWFVTPAPLVAAPEGMSSDVPEQNIPQQQGEG